MLHYSGDRRTFLKYSLAGALMLFGAGPVLAKKSFAEQMPEGRLSLYNIHTGERLSAIYRNQNGEYDPQALKDLNWLLRCEYDNKAVDMDTKVIEYLNIMDNQFGGDNEIHVISGYRTPAFNHYLREEGRHVAHNSFHMRGRAIDFFIPRVELKNIRRAALSLQYGGVGYYPQDGFVHIDSGRFRTW